MGRKFRLLSVLALALTIGAVSLVSTAAGTKPDGKHFKIIDLTLLTVQEAVLEEEPPGPSLGDRFVFSDDVFSGDKRIGTSGGECTVTRVEPDPLPAGQEPTSATVQCIVTLRLPEGQITTQALVTFSAEAGPQFTVAVTGGTGAYRTAHGQGIVTPGAQEDDPSRLRLELIL
jgi:hypothetical protein